ncbi:MAG: oligosaccharide flippase family protein [Desulfurococcaceae archaeon]
MSAEEYELLRTTRQALAYATLAVVQLFAQVATLMYVSRVLGAGGYGLYTLSLVPSAFMSLVADLGIDAATFRYASSYSAREPEKLGGLFKASLAVKFLLSAVAAAPLVLAPEALSLALSNRPGLGDLVALTSLLLVLSTLMNNVASFLAGVGDAWGRSWTIALYFSSRFVLAVILLSLSPTPMSALLASTLCYGVGLVYGLARARNYLLAGSRIPAEDLGEMFRFALTMYILGLGGAVLGRLQQYLISLYTAPLGLLGNVLVGDFNAASAFLGAIGSVYGALAIPLLPLLARRNNRGGVELSALLLEALAFVEIPIAVYAMAFSSDLIRLIYGPSYTRAPGFFLLMAVSLLLSPASSVVGYYLQAINDLRGMAIANVATFASGLILVLGLGSIAGVAGIAAAIGLYQVVYALTLAAYASARYGLGVHKRRLATYALTSVATVGLSRAFVDALSIEWSLGRIVASAALAYMLYAVFLGLLRGISETNESLIRKMARGLPLLGPLLSAFLSVYEYFSRL